jgi:flagellar basal body-associated protein FliL
MRGKLRTILLVYIVALATVFAVVAIALLVSANHTAQTNAHRIEQLQRDTNDNLCNQQAYEGGTQCEGGDANG